MIQNNVFLYKFYKNCLPINFLKNQTKIFLKLKIKKMIKILLFATIIHNSFSSDSSSTVPICSDLTMFNGDKWIDSYGWDCNTFSIGIDYCSSYGDDYANDGHTGN